MQALIIGATGATGKDLLHLLLKDKSFHQVDIFVRRNVDIVNEKLKVHIIDFDKPDEWKHLVKGDVLFSCLGTTMKMAGSKEAQWKIDYEYQYQFAKAAKENNIHHYILISSLGASPDSVIFYSKMKGQLEEAIKKLNFPKVTIFQPPILERKNTERKGERVSVNALHFLNKIGLFGSQKPLPTEILAQAMINSAKAKESGLTVLKNNEIRERAQIK
jgi:uncharacterized protein YbjT (DUF2867 family)